MKAIKTMAQSPLSERTLEEVVFTRVVRLDATVHGIVTGVVFGFMIFFATIILLIKGGEVVGPHLALLGNFFIGYQVTVIGSFIGLGYGFITGFVIGWFMAVVYNQLLRIRKVEQ